MYFENKVVEAARRYEAMNINSDAKGQWLFANGDKVNWCAAAALRCLEQGGICLATSWQDQANLRKVDELVKRLEKITDVSMRIIKGSNYDDSRVVLYAVKDEAGGFNHIGLAVQLNSEKCAGYEGNFSNSFKLVVRYDMTDLVFLQAANDE